MAFLFSGLLNSTWTTCSSGEERTSVSYAGSPPLVDMADTLNEEGGTDLVHLEIIPSQRKKTNKIICNVSLTCCKHLLSPDTPTPSKFRILRQ